VPDDIYEGMSHHPVVIRTAKLASAAAIVGSGRHTWRERPTPNADPTRTPSNADWRTVHSADELAAAVAARVELATDKAKEPVLCIEYLITAKREAFREGGGQVDAAAYFRDALTWLEKRHGKENVVAVNIQLDEMSPHMVAYVVPLVETAAKTRTRSVIVGTNDDGTRRRELREFFEPAKTRLSSAHFQGTPKKLKELQSDFAVEVGALHGLVRGQEGSKAHHTTIAQWYGTVNQAAALQERLGKVLKGAKRLGQELVQHAPARAKELGLIQETTAQKQRTERDVGRGL
jgi:hypothetical protein